MGSENLVITTTEKLSTDKYILNHANGWFWSTKEWLKYSSAYTPGSIDRSFAVMEEDNIVGLCSLIQQGGKFLMHDPGPWPLVKNEDVMFSVIKEIEFLAKVHKIKLVKFRSSPLAEDPSLQEYNLFLSMGYKGISWDSQVINLDQPLDKIWDGVSKGHRSEIHKGLRNYEFILMKDINMIHDCHVIANGRETRSKETWDIMRDWNLKGSAPAWIASNGHSPIGAIMFNFYKNSAYYSLGAYPQNCIAHSMIWTAIRCFQILKMKTIELGWLNQVSLSQFKKGFGGEAKKIYAMEKRW